MVLFTFMVCLVVYCHLGEVSEAIMFTLTHVCAVVGPLE